MHTFNITYVLDNRIRTEQIIADTMDEALLLFRRRHPKLRILSIVDLRIE